MCVSLYLIILLCMSVVCGYVCVTWGRRCQWSADLLLKQNRLPSQERTRLRRLFCRKMERKRQIIIHSPFISQNHNNFHNEEKERLFMLCAVQFESSTSPPWAAPRAFELLKIGLFKFPPLGARKLFKCPTNFLLNYLSSRQISSSIKHFTRLSERDMP